MHSQGCRWCDFVGSQSKEAQARSSDHEDGVNHCLTALSQVEQVCAAQHPGPGPVQQFSVFFSEDPKGKTQTLVLFV